MKSIATLIGWVAIGAITTIAGQQVWKHFQRENPQQSEQISTNVKETINKGAETLKETAEVIAKKTEEEPIAEETVTEAPTPEPEKTELVESEKAVTAPVKKELTPEQKETAITDRFYKLAEGNILSERVKQDDVPKESAEDYVQRQRSFSRQEDVVIERQMRIVDELSN